MSVENLTENSPLPMGGLPEQKTRSKGTSTILWFQLAVFVLGLGLLAFLVYKIGLNTITDSLRSIGWGFLIIIALNGSRHFLRALCVYLAIPRDQHHFKYRWALAARLGGEAVSLLSFTGPILGEATKAALLKKRVPLSHGVAAVVVDNILYDFSVTMIMLSGAFVMLYLNAGGKTMTYMLVGVIIFAVTIGVLLTLMVRHRFKPVTWLIKVLSNKNWLPKAIAGKKDAVFEVESNVYEFYNKRRATFYALLGIDFVAHTLSVCEVYIALSLLGSTPTVANSYVIESLTKVINLTFSFVPATIGVYESGNGVILHALGYATAVGITLALVRKGAIIFWTLVGLVILLWRGIARSHRRVTKKED